MAGNDGTLNFDTKIDSSGFQKGANTLGGLTTQVLKGATAGVAALGAATIKVGSDFEAGMSQVQAISGASGEELERLKNKAKEMGASTKFSATESAEALNYMAMAGWKTEDMLGGLEGVMNLAAASGEDLATSSDIVTDAMTALGMQASEAGHFSDVLAAAASNANTSVDGMGETFKYAGAMAGTLGYSVEDIALATGLMANAGIKGTMAGTSLNSIMTRLSTNTNGARDAIEELGVSCFNSDGSARSLTDVMSELREATKDMTTEQKANFANTVAGMEAQKGLSAILNATEDDYNKLSEAIQNADGCALEMAETMQDNLQGQLTILQSGLEGLGISIYETIQGTAKDVVKEAQGMVQQLQDAFNEGGLGSVVSAVGDVLAQIVQRLAEAAPELINMAVNLVGSFCEGLKSAPGIGDAGANLISSLVTGILSCVGDLWSTAVVIFAQLLSGMAVQLPQILETGKEVITQFAQSLSKNAPSVLSSVGIIVSTLLEGFMSAIPQISSVGVDVLNKLAEGIETSLPTLIPAAMQALMEFSGSLRENAGLLVDAGLNLVMTLAQSLIDSIPVFIETIPTIITNIAGIINDNAPKLLASGVGLIGKLIMGLIQAIPTLIANIPQIIEAIVSVFTAFNWLSLGKNIITFITNGIKSLANSIPNAIKGIGQTAMDWLRAINWNTLGADIIDLIVIGVNSLLTAIPNLLRSIGHTAVGFFKSIDWLGLGVNVVNGIISGITGALNGLWLAIGGLCSGMLDSLITWGQQMLSSMQTAVQGVVNSAGQVMSQLPGKIWTWLVNVVTKVTAWGQQMISKAKSAIQNMISSIISLMSQLPGKVWAQLSNVLSKVAQFASDLMSKATAAARGFVTNIKNGLASLPGDMVTIGGNIVKGIWKGISSGWNWLKNKVASLAKSLLDAAKNALGIKSPSTVFRDEFGRWLMPGAVQGVQKSMPQTLRDMKKEAGKLVTAMQGTVNASMGNFTLAAAGGAGLKASTSAGTIVEIDNSQSQENNYHVAVPSPSEVAKNQREAFRNFQKGVK